MTLSEIAAHVCAKVGQTDAESVAICKQFADHRYRMLWDAALWRDTLALVSVNTIAASNWLLMPVGIERVVKVRVNTTTVGPFDAATIFDYNPDLFDNQGTASGFLTFAPAVIGPMDGTTPIFVTNQGSHGTEDLDARATYEVEYNPTRQALGTDSLVSTQALQPDFTISGGLVQFLLRFNKPVTTLAYQLIYGNAGPIVAAAATQAPRRARIKLLQGPAGATACLVLGKRACPGLTEDGETALLRNSDNYLIAASQSDMLERQRQYAKAQMKGKEASAHIQIMLELERTQSAQETRIIPADVQGFSQYGGEIFAQGKEFWMAFLIATTSILWA